MTNVAAPSWPGLAGLKLQPLQIERAVWGKVHGQTSDFRWIARSDGLALDSTLHQALSLGSEDKPRDAVCWRALEDCFVAMRIYPSRARDAASRSGFLEKQLLILRRHEEIPAALAAMVLLPRVAQMSDQVWWPYRESSDWSRPDFVLKLESQENLPITVSADELKTRIELGTSELKEKIGMDQLASLYQALSDGLRPTFLPDLDQPLSPEALATLLLPLERAKADQLSLAGWIPSARVQTEGLANWDLVIGINQQFSAKRTAAIENVRFGLADGSGPVRKRSQCAGTRSNAAAVRGFTAPASRKPPWFSSRGQDDAPAGSGALEPGMRMPPVATGSEAQTHRRPHHPHGSLRIRS